MELILLLDAMTAQLIYMELLSVIKSLGNVLDHLVSLLIWTGPQTVDIYRQMMEMVKDIFTGCQVKIASRLHIIYIFLVPIKYFKISLEAEYELHLTIENQRRSELIFGALCSFL